MKIRNGFVSNSSSSSFIISDKNFKSVRELATYMINRKYDEYGDYGDYGGGDKKQDEYRKNEHDKYLNFLQNLDENQAITFQSCNYDTYIKKVADCYLISTCNNEDWDLWKYNTKLSEDAKSELKIILQKYNDNDDGWYSINSLLDGDSEFYSFDNDYYSLDYQVIGSESNESCPKCKQKGDYQMMWNTKKHGLICLVCNPVYKRKDKLCEIKKIHNNYLTINFCIIK